MGWGSSWGTSWGGGSGEAGEAAPIVPPAPVVVPSPSAVIDQFAANVLAILSGSTLRGRFREAGYRRRLEKEPEGGSNGMFTVEAVAGSQGRPYIGTGTYVRLLAVVVSVSYFRSADRRRANRNAADDMIRICDLCENPANYNRAATGINFVRSLGSQKTLDLKRSEIWEARFEVEWEQDPIT